MQWQQKQKIKFKLRKQVKKENHKQKSPFHTKEQLIYGQVNTAISKVHWQ